MAIIGKASNRNIRLISIFKVIGIYLITLLLLIWIFNLNKSDSITTNSNAGPVAEHYKQLKEEMNALSLMVTYIDTIATITEELIKLDGEELAKTGSKEGKIKRLEKRKDDFYELLLDINKEALGTEKKKFDNVYDILARNRGKVELLRIEQSVKEEDVERRIEKAVEEEKGACETQLNALSARSQVAGQSLTTTEEEVVSLTTSLGEKQKAYDGLVEKKKDILTKVVEIRELIEKEKMDGSIVKNRKKLVNLIYHKTIGLETLVKN